MLLGLERRGWFPFHRKTEARSGDPGDPGHGLESCPSIRAVGGVARRPKVVVRDGKRADDVHETAKEKDDGCRKPYRLHDIARGT